MTIKGLPDKPRQGDKQGSAPETPPEVASDAGAAAASNARPFGIVATGVAIAVIGLGWWQWGHDDEGGPTAPERSVLERLPSGEGETLPDGRQMTVLSSYRTTDGLFCREYETHRDRVMRISIACREFWDWNRRFSITVISEGELLLPGSGSMQNLDDYLTESNLGQRLTPETEAAALAELRD